MALELYVNGCFEVSFIDILTKEDISEETEKLIFENLNNGSYIFGMDSKTIFSLDNFIPLYTVIIDSSDDLSYEWDEI
jgi:hypothetical protein